MPHVPSGRLPGYGGGSQFLTDIMSAKVPAKLKRHVLHQRLARHAGWQHLVVEPHLATPKKTFQLHTAGSSSRSSVPDMQTVIGAYKEVKKLANNAGAKESKLAMTEQNGDAAAEALERAADSLDSISSSMIKSKAKPSRGKLASIAKSLSSISAALGASPEARSTKDKVVSARSIRKARAVKDHGAQLLHSHLTALVANATNYTKAAYWKSFELNPDGTIKL